MIRKLVNLTLWIVLAIVAIGCDDRATNVAREAANRQAQQNRTMAGLNKEVASGTHRLVEADAQARKEIVAVHRDLQAERTRLDTGWNRLESERQRIASQRRTESMLGPLATLLGGLLLVVVLLGFCWYAVGAAHANENHDSELNRLLVRDLMDGESLLLAAGRRPPPMLEKSGAP